MLFRFAGLKLEGLTDEQQSAVRQGVLEFMQFQREHEAEARAQVEAAQKAGGEGDIRLYRLLETTGELLMYSGIAENEGKIRAYMQAWDKLGYPKVVKALGVRLEEAKTPYQPQPEELSEDEFTYIPDPEEYEEAPVTQRSFAKLFQFANTFYKVARGQK